MQTTFETAGLNKRPSHSILNVILIASTAVSFALMIFFNAASNFPAWGIFKKTNAQISDQFTVNITPAGWTFSTWGAIYTWQALWIVFSIVTIFLKNDTENGAYLYLKPNVLTPLFFTFIISNFLFNIGWLFAFTQEQFWGAFVILALIALTLYGAIWLSHRNIYLASLTNTKKVYIWLYRILVNNGLVFYATWVTIATMLNFNISLVFDSGVGEDTASYVCLSILTLILIGYFSMDIYFFEKYTRFTFSIYLQLLIAFAGVLSKNWQYKYGSNYFVLVLAIIGPGLMFAIKLAVTIINTIKERSLSRVNRI